MQWEKAENVWWGDAGALRCGFFGETVRSGGRRWQATSQSSVWVWLNLSGSGLLWGERERFILKPGMYAMTGGAEASQWSCVRYPGKHGLAVVVIPRSWLLDRLGKQPGWLHENLQHWLRDGGDIGFCGLMGVWERDLGMAIEQAVAEPGPARLLAEARVLEWAAVRLFRSHAGDAGGGFCTAIRSQDPVKRALTWLREHSDEPLDLAKIAQSVGISPHHLSRRVSVETGLTLLRHLRRIRIERACEALSSGKMNVTEVALEVGYQSLSHFAKAFREETGILPNKWATKKIV